MKISFLGTSSGTPTKHRNVSAIAIIESKGSNWHLIDCGEGTQHQLLSSNLSLNNLTTICITHVHGDHCYGLPGLLASAGMSGRKTPLTIIAPQGIKEWFEATQVHTQLFLPYELIFLSTEELTKVKMGQFNLSSTKLSHRVPSFSYIFKDCQADVSLDLVKLKSSGLPRGPLWGKLQAGIDVMYEERLYISAEYLKCLNAPRKVIVCGDNDKPQLLSDECTDCNLLIHESTYTEDMASKASNVGHSYAKQIASFAQDHSIPNLILTHFSPRYQSNPEHSPSIADIGAEANQVYSGKLHLAEDFQIFNLDKTGYLTLESEGE